VAEKPVGVSTVASHLPTAVAHPHPVQRACTRCSCDRFEGLERFCEICGHARSDHPPTALDLLAAACTVCDCLTFRGGLDARHCGACGHRRAVHSLDDPPPADPPEGLAPRNVAVIAAMLAAVGGAMLAWGLALM
jgi:hypothetical protein